MNWVGNVYIIMIGTGGWSVRIISAGSVFWGLNVLDDMLDGLFVGLIWLGSVLMDRGVKLLSELVSFVPVPRLPSVCLSAQSMLVPVNCSPSLSEQDDTTPYFPSLLDSSHPVRRDSIPLPVPTHLVTS